MEGFLVNIIALDCEFNQPSKKLIEVGAFVFRHDFKEVKTFQTYVNPGEQINPEITELTGIGQTEVDKAPHVASVVFKLLDFKHQKQINAIGVVWGSGEDSNDISKIFTEANVENPFARRVIDVKGVYQMLANHSSADMRARVGLGKALNNMGLLWDDRFGPPHRALADAYNTFRAYRHLAKCLKGGFDLHKSFDK